MNFLMPIEILLTLSELSRLQLRNFLQENAEIQFLKNENKFSTVHRESVCCEQYSCQGSWSCRLRRLSHRGTHHVGGPVLTHCGSLCHRVQWEYCLSLSHLQLMHLFMSSSCTSHPFIVMSFISLSMLSCFPYFENLKILHYIPQYCWSKHWTC